MTEDEALLEEFREEAQEALDEAEDALIKIDQNSEVFDECYPAVFRAFHSLKGAAGMFEQTEVQNIFHHLEELLEKRKQYKNIPSILVDYFLKGMDAAKIVLLGEQMDFKFYDPLAEEKVVDKVEKESVANVDPLNEQVELDNQIKPDVDKQGLVYVVDDEPDLAELISELVQDFGFETVIFTDAMDLLKSLKSRKPDVVLSDIKMPNMTGIEMIEEIQQIDPDVPVVFLSGYLDKDTCIEALSFGAYALMDKPIQDEERLNAVLRNASRKHQSMKLLNRSINFIMYQYSDLDQMLKSQGKESLREMMKKEFQIILENRQFLKNIKKSVI
ncbi:MAG: response regulator [Bdellovibrionaceae bacterium]|jgi:CheY-like chemotaxis protein|nr:response regulator [Pseudobdellovibrionaceae bacterium]